MAKNISVWQEINLPDFPKLEGDINTDVLIIGGGMAGILTAYMLHQAGVKYVLVEGRRICSGTTQNTTAKITAQHGLNYHKLLKGAGLEKARDYLNANLAAYAEYAKMCSNIDCDYEAKDNFVYSVNNRKKLEDEMDALHKIGYEAELCENLDLPFATAGAVKFPNQAQFNPLKFISAIAGDLHIYENSFVYEMEPGQATIEDGRVRASKIIVATHFPFINKHGSYFLKLHQHRSYVLALKNAEKVDGMFVDEDHKGFSFRNYGKHLLLGGGGHRTGMKGGGWDELRTFAEEHYPKAEETNYWAAQDCMSLDGTPYIGQYSKRAEDLYVATGFNKWGMTGSMVSAMILRDKILGRSNEFEAVFDPSRSILKPQLFVNGCISVGNLIMPLKKRCPHLGCALKWNNAERSWDCACHGSRFSEDGKVLDNPANGDI